MLKEPNNSIKGSPQKDVGLDAQKAARPLLLGVRHIIKGSNCEYRRIIQ